MGCGGSSRVYSAKSLEDSDNGELDLIGLNAEQKKAFYNAFSKIDSQDAGWVLVTSVVKAADTIESAFINTLYESLKMEKEWLLNFKEFVLATWRFCCQSHDEIVEYAFKIYLGEKNTELDSVHIKHMLVDVNGMYTKKQGVDWMLANFDVDRNSHISLSEFCECVKSTPLLFKKIFNFQNNLKALIGDDTFWDSVIASSKSKWSLPEVTALFLTECTQGASVRDRLSRRTTIAGRIRNASVHFQLHSMSHRKKRKQRNKHQKAGNGG